MNTPKLRLFLYTLLVLLIVLPYGGLFVIKQWYERKSEQIVNSRFVIIDKDSMQLHLYNYNGERLYSFGIACGKNYGDKQVRGDLKTPEGIFHISDIEESSSWDHDFHDGKGRVTGAYGPWFIRLDVPNQKGIGIHGTHKPESIGTRDTEGCVRLRNEDLLVLKPLLNVGMVVVILPSYYDLAENHECSDALPN